MNVSFKFDSTIQQYLKQFDISEKHLNLIFSNLLSLLKSHNTLRKYSINVKYVEEEGFGAYTYDKHSIIQITKKGCKSRRMFILTLLHEFRHWVQHIVSRIAKHHVVTTTPKQYFKNKYEQQCSAFEKKCYKYVIDNLKHLSKISNYENL